MANDIDMRLVTAELEIFARRVGAERFIRLAVGVAPEMHKRRVLGHHAQRVGAAQHVADVVERADRHLAGSVGPQFTENRP